jgi:hypothetical protein
MVVAPTIAVYDRGGVIVMAARQNRKLLRKQLDFIGDYLASWVMSVGGNELRLQLVDRLSGLSVEETLAFYQSAHSSPGGWHAPDEIFVTSANSQSASAQWFFAVVRQIFAAHAAELVERFGEVRGITWEGPLRGARELILEWMTEALMVDHSKAMLVAYHAVYAEFRGREVHANEWRQRAQQTALSLLGLRVSY